MKTQTLGSRLAWTVCLALVLGLAWGSSTHAVKSGGGPPGHGGGAPGPADVTHSGRAFAASVSLPTLMFERKLADTGELPPNGGTLTANELKVALDGVLEASVLDAATSGDTGQSRSQASLVTVVVLRGSPAEVQATFVQAETSATCNDVNGNAEVLGLMVGGKAINLEPFAPNQQVTIPGVGTLFINEQIITTGGGVQAISVNAIRVSLVTGDEIIVAHAESDVGGCPGCPSTPVCADRFTGGGWIAKDGGRVTFGVHAGADLRGHVNVVDHTTGLHIQSATITAYRVGDTVTTRVAEGTTTDGASFVLEVADNGEPGRKDTFSLKLGTGYEATGPLGGGNIQLHNPCP